MRQKPNHYTTCSVMLETVSFTSNMEELTSDRVPPHRERAVDGTLEVVVTQKPRFEPFRLLPRLLLHVSAFGALKQHPAAECAIRLTVQTVSIVEFSCSYVTSLREICGLGFPMFGGTLLSCTVPVPVPASLVCMAY